MLDRVVNGLRARRWAHVVAAVLRILLGFAFLPAGLKKVLGQPFTDPNNIGPFHEFLHAFLGTGVFYQFVGVVQVTIALLLMTQRYATLGAAMALPIFTAITVFCWSTQVPFTAVMTTLMWLGTVALVLWDKHKWRPLLGPYATAPTAAAPPGDGLVDGALWARCGGAIFAVYLVITALSGGVYRPKGVELDNPQFYVLPLVTLFPVVAFVIEQRRRRRPPRHGEGL